MRRTLLAAAAISGIGITGAGWTVAADAQQTQAPTGNTPGETMPAATTPSVGHGPGMGRDHPMPGPMHGMEEMHGWMHHQRPLALIFRAPDRKLGGADVQKIAEAFLLWNGNHSWKITNVQEGDDTVAFSVAVPDGTTIARFTMDRHTGQIERQG